MSSRRVRRPPAKRSQLNNIAESAAEEISVPPAVALDKISLPSRQPRRYFDPDAMQSLVESVKKDGILQPLLVRPVGDKYELVAGERRYRAAREAGLTDVPVTVREMSLEQAVQYALTENLQREDLNPVEETEGILQLLAFRLGCDLAEVTPLLYRLENEAKGKITRHVSGSAEAETVERVFAEVGRMNWQSFVRTRLPLLNLPADILSELGSGRIEYTKARAIAKLESESERMALLAETIAQCLSLSQIQERVRARKPAKQTDELQNRFDTTVKQIKKSSVWDSPSKRQKLESLLAEMQALIVEED